MAHHKHGGGTIRKSHEPVSAATNRMGAGSQGAGPQLDVASNMNQPGGGAPPAGNPVGPGAPAPDAATAVPPGAVPR